MLRLGVEAHPNARVERVEHVNGTLRVWVRARAVEGRANAAIELVVAEALGLRPRQIRIVGGTRSRQKIVEVDCSNLDELRARLAALEQT